VITATASLVRTRAQGAMLGLALGDALGMPTQAMSRDAIRRRYGAISGLVGSIPDQPIAPGMVAGSVTDDTEQAILLAQLLLSGQGHIEPMAFAHALIAWEESMQRRGSLDLLGPSTKSAIAAIQSGAGPTESGRFGTTNGAAMRVAPVGIAFPTRCAHALLTAVVESCQVTHFTSIGISGAAAVAGAVSAGIDGMGVDDCVDFAVEMADAGQKCGNWIAGASIGSRISWARREVRILSETDFKDALYNVVGTSVQSQESIVAAFVIVDRYRDDPFRGLCTAAEIGGDTDTVAAMAGAMFGAMYGPTVFPEESLGQVQEVSSLSLDPLVDGLLRLRSRHQD
jgi:ADP-ribosylglycohydrolase